MVSWDILFFAGIVFFGFVGLMYIECLVASMRSRTDMLIALGDKLDRNYRQLEALDVSTSTMVCSIEQAEEDCRQMYFDWPRTQSETGDYNGTGKPDVT